MTDTVETQLKHIKDTESHSAEGNTREASARVRAWSFTLNNYTEADILFLTSTLNTERYCFQEEIAPTTGTPHLQGMIYFKNGKSFTELKKLHRRWNLERTKCVKGSLSYCSMDDKLKPPNGRTFIKGFKIPKKLKLLDEAQFYPWQIKVSNMIKEEPDDRSIIWIYETSGCEGKTSLIKYLLNTYKESAYYVSGGRANDITFQIVENEQDIHLFLMNIPRNNEGFISYNGIEQVKDGLVSTSKYKGGFELFNPPHVIVMCNFYPDITSLSLDRWKIYEIKNNDLEYQPVAR